MTYLFLLLFFVCVFGIFRPFKSVKRWQFGVAAFVSFILVGVTAPDPKTEANPPTKPNSVAASPAELATLEKKNAAQIAALKKQAEQLPASDVEGNLKLYKQLSELAPANTEFSQKVGQYESKISARARYSNYPEEALTIEDFDWNAGGFGSIMEISRLTVRNDAPFPIKDFELRCVHQGNSGTDMDRNTRTVFEIVPANGKKTVRDINMGFISSQVKTSRCEIESAVAI